MKLLIVDDQADSLYMLETLLKGNDYEVVSAVDGVEALAKLRSNTIDIIISDILMPRMDGFRLCRECKKDDSLKDIPFIFYTASYTDERDEKLALSLGANGFIAKPLQPEAFIKIIKTLVDEVREPGRYSVTWDGKDGNNVDVMSGVYLINMEAGNKTSVKKMMLVR